MVLALQFVETILRKDQSNVMMQTWFQEMAVLQPVQLRQERLVLVQERILVNLYVGMEALMEQRFVMMDQTMELDVTLIALEMLPVILARTQNHQSVQKFVEILYLLPQKNAKSH